MKTEKQEAIERLLEWVKPGDTIYTVLRHCSRSGMSRVIDLKKINGEEVLKLGWNTAKAIGLPYDCEREGVKAGGCGMDMGFHLVYELGATLFPGGFACIGESCPSNDHTNGMPRTHTYAPDTCPGSPCASGCDHVGIPPVVHKSGGYALKHRWL